MLRHCCRGTLFLLFSAGLTASASDWPRFRGPNGTGIAEGTLPDINPAKPLWKVKLPGKANSSPIVVGDKVFLQTASPDGKTRSLLCVSTSNGKIEWTKDVPGAAARTHSKNSLASGTPASDGERIFCPWWDGESVSLHAYDLSGKALWQASLGGYTSQHGPGFSPMVHDGLVFVNVDDDRRSELVALDAASGEKKWVAERKHERASYSTPFLLERAGKPVELILGTTTAITSYEPKSGKVNWDFPIVWPKGQMPLRVVGNPCSAAGQIILSCGDGGGSRHLVAVNLEGRKLSKSWELRKETPYVPCMLVSGERLYWIDDNGIAACIDAKTSKPLWSERVFNGFVFSSPILVGDKMLAISERGDIAILKADKEFEEPTTVQLGERVYSSPAAAKGKVYIRGEKHLYCFGEK